MPKCIFEPMSALDIVGTLMGWGLACNEQQLAQPTQKFVENVYFTCLRQLTSLDNVMIHDPSKASVDNVILDTESELFMEPLVNNILLYHLGRIARAARLDSFSSMDLTHPTPMRTREILSAFINFIKFADVNCGAFIDQVQSRSREIIVERDNASKQLSERLAQINQIKAQHAVDEPQCETLRKENETYRKRMLKCKDQQREITSEFENAKMEKHQLLNRKENFNLEYNRVESLLSETRSRVVQSPDRIKRTIGMLTTRTHEEKANVSAQEAKSRELQVKITTLTSIDQDVKALVEQLKQIEREFLMLDDTRKELIDLRTHLDSTTIQAEEQQERSKRGDRQIANAKEKLERAQKHAEDKRMTSQKTIERLQAEYDQMSIERRENDKQLEELKTDGHQIETKMAEHLKTSEEELNDLLKAYWSLRHETDLYMATLSDKLSMSARRK